MGTTYFSTPDGPAPDGPALGGPALGGGMRRAPPLGAEGTLLFTIRVVEPHMGHLPIRGPSWGAKGVPELTLVMTRRDPGGPVLTLTLNTGS